MAKPAREQPLKTVCCVCKDHVGEETGELPMRISDDGGDGEGSVETYCPRCFVHVRGSFDARWSAAIAIGQISAVTCMNPKCKLTSVSFGHKGCQQCGSRAWVLPPKNTLFSSKALDVS
jgi:hypothetical protein